LGKGTCLKFVRVSDINLIPRHLFEKVKPMDFDVDELYKWAPVLLSNPLNILGAFLDKGEQVRGTMMCSYNPINKTISVYMLSVENQYYGRGILREADGIVHKMKKQMGAKKISIVTSRPRALEKIGYNRSCVTMMEK
jgi:hypothetical protein